MSNNAPSPPYYHHLGTPPSPQASKPLLADMDQQAVATSPQFNTNANPPVQAPGSLLRGAGQAPNPQQQQEQQGQQQPSRPTFWPSASGWNPSYSPGVGQSLPGQNKSRPAPAVVSSCNVIPTPLLGRWPAMVHCPACDTLGLTEVKYSAGTGTHALAVLLLFTTGIGVVVPYIAPQCKDVEHSCSHCSSVLATHWFMGGTEAHMF